MSIRGTSRFHSMPLSVGGGNQANYTLPVGGSGNGGDYAGQFGRQQSYSVNGGLGGAGTDINEHDSLLIKAHKYSEKVDAFLGQVGTPVKPYLPLIGRFLIVATFFEDGLRIFTQWNSQVNYIWSYRGMPWFLTVIYLALNIVLMYAGSVAVVWHRHLIPGVGSLLFVVISQAMVYGLLFNFSFFFRNLSVIGGLMMVLSDAFVRDRRSLSLPGLPDIEDKDRSKYFLLAGRVLMIFLFLAYVASEHLTVLGLIGVLIGGVACVLVVIGYKARLSASVLILILLYRNLTANQYWSVESGNPVRDFLRYEHFQILSIIGGLLLVVNSGAGAFSIDEKKKIY